MQNLGEVLIAFSEAGLTLNLKKCKFGLRKTEYLGHVVGEGTLQPGPRKVQAIAEMPRAQNVTDIK